MRSQPLPGQLPHCPWLICACAPGCSQTHGTRSPPCPTRHRGGEQQSCHRPHSRGAALVSLVGLGSGSCFPGPVGAGWGPNLLGVPHRPFLPPPPSPQSLCRVGLSHVPPDRESPGTEGSQPVAGEGLVEDALCPHPCSGTGELRWVSSRTAASKGVRAGGAQPVPCMSPSGQRGAQHGQGPVGTTCLRDFALQHKGRIRPGWNWRCIRDRHRLGTPALSDLPQCPLPTADPGRPNLHMRTNPSVTHGGDR